MDYTIGVFYCKSEVLTKAFALYQFLCKTHTKWCTYSLFELLNSDKIFLFVDAHNEKVWEWQGKNTSTRMKFITTQLVPSIRDKHDISYTITTVDEGDETVAFKIMIGLP